MLEKKYNQLLSLLAILSFVGMIVTTYLIYQHYKPAGGSFCNVNDYVNCDIVNKSIYAEIFNIPVSILGFAAYVVLLGGALLARLGFRKHILIPLLALFAAFSLLFSLYLTYVEFFILKAICVLCVTQQILILFIFILFLILWFLQRKARLFS